MTDVLDAPVREPIADPGALLDLLSDEDVRALFEAAGESRTIPELAAACELPRSTAYRKVKRLVSAELLVPRSHDAENTGTATEYRRAVDGVEIEVGDETTVAFV